jgi:hypothetical protein
MKISNFKFQISNRIGLILLAVFIFNFTAFSQSTEQKFPTLVTSSEISGKISARDIGDSRLTTYYYAFNGTQGDVFLTIETNNLNGDIDIFTADELRPVTKIALFADSSNNQTVRTIYLRKDEKLILRIEGKTPNDDDATYKIKFEGSFAAITDAKTVEVEAPKVKSKTDSDVVVNSVGTIIEVKQKPTPEPKVEIAKVEKIKIPKTPRVKPTPKPKAEKPKVEETETAGEVSNTQKPSVKPAKVKKPKVETAENLPKPETPKPEKPKKMPKPKVQPKPKSETAAALESVKLLVELKDGTKYERPMSEVLRVNVDKDGMLTIVTKDGKIERYSILDVAKMTIQ